MFALSVLLVLFVLGADAAWAAGDGCTTKYGPNQVARIRTARTKTTQIISITKHIRYKSRVTVTRPTKTMTATVTDMDTTSTTSYGSEITATTTRTDTHWITETTSVTSTIIKSVTESKTISSTTVIPTSVGFAAIKDAPGYVPRARAVEAHKRAEKKAKNKPSKGYSMKVSKKAKKLEVDPVQYVQRVDCTRTIRKRMTTTTEITIKGRTIYPKAPRTMTTVTDTTTSTVTAHASGSTVSTITVSEVVTSTTETFPVTSTTETETVTEEIIIPVTNWAACQSNNFLYSANGNHGIIGLNSGYTNELAGGSTEMDCCVMCAQRQECMVSWLFNIYGFLGCGMLVTGGAGTCPAGGLTAGTYKTDSNTQGTGYYILSNGPCGRWANGDI